MTDIVPFFAVPFAFSRLDDCAALNAELRTLFHQKMSEGDRWRNPRPYTQRNDRVWESNFDLFRWQEPSARALRDFCLGSLLQVVCEMNNYDEATRKRMLIYHDAWFHVTRRSGFFGMHNHPNASWSGVYCIDPGHHDKDRPDSGLLSFVSPLVTTAMHLDAGNANLQGAFAPQVRHIRHEPGQLVLFPSWVLHDVKPYEGEGERITVAFNCWFALQTETGAPATQR